MEISNLLKISKSYELGSAEYSTLWEDLRHRATHLRKLIDFWRSTELTPLLPATSYSYTLPSTPDSRDSNIYPDGKSALEQKTLLLAVLDCVSNSALIGLHRLVVSLTPLTSSRLIEDLCVSSCSITLADRQASVRAAFEFVHSLSIVSAKPLEFGMRQLWSPDSFFNKICSILDSSIECRLAV